MAAAVSKITGKSDLLLYVCQKNVLSAAISEWLAKWRVFSSKFLPLRVRTNLVRIQYAADGGWVLFQVTNGWLA